MDKPLHMQLQLLQENILAFLDQRPNRVDIIDIVKVPVFDFWARDHASNADYQFRFDFLQHFRNRYSISEVQLVKCDIVLIQVLRERRLFIDDS